MEPVQPQSQTATNNGNLPPPPPTQSPQPIQNSSSSKKIPIGKMLVALALLILVLVIAILSALLYQSSQPKIENAIPIKEGGEFPEFRKGFESSIKISQVIFDYENLYRDEYKVLNQSTKIDDVVRIGCSDWESTPYEPNKAKKEPVRSLNIIYGVIGKGDFWNVSLIKKDIEIGKPYYLPIYTDFYDRKPPEIGRIYSFVDYNPYDSDNYNSTGSITVTKFEGCEIGDEIEFNINAIIGQANEDLEDLEYLSDEAPGLQLVGEFHGTVNIAEDKNPYEIIIPQEEHKKYIKTYNDRRKLRLDKIEQQYLDEYGYDEEDIDNFFDDEIDSDNEDESVQKRDQKRQSDITQILNAVGAFSADNKGNLPIGITCKEQEISLYEADICQNIVGTYIPALPVDPDFNTVPYTVCDEYESGYYIYKDVENKVTVSAAGELTYDISITRVTK